MATLAADAPVTVVEGFRNAIGIIANDIVYEGAMVGENGSGYGRPLVAGDKFVGHAISKTDNTVTGPKAVAGAAGDLDIPLRNGRYRLEVSLAGYITDVGQPVYASDDAVLTFNPSGNSYVGVVRRYVSATKLEVEFRPGEEDEFGNNANRATKSADYSVLATDSGKVIYVDTDTKIMTMPSTVSGIDVTIVNIAPAGTALIAIDFQAGDKSLGGCGVAAGGDGKQLQNTKATAKRGDFIRLHADGTDGYYIVGKRGTWAVES